MRESRGPAVPRLHYGECSTDLTAGAKAKAGGKFSWYDRGKEIAPWPKEMRGPRPRGAALGSGPCGRYLIAFIAALARSWYSFGSLSIDSALVVLPPSSTSIDSALAAPSASLDPVTVTFTPFLE